MSQTITGGIDVYPYPSTNRTHGTFAVIDPTGANTGQASYPTVIVGQVTAAGSVSGTAAIAQPALANGLTADQLRTLYGPGSELARLAMRYAARDPFATTYLVPLADDPAAVAATLPITFGGTVTAAGVIPLYIDGVNVPVAAPAGMTGAQAAAAVAAAVAAQSDQPVTAAAAAAVITLTAKNKGLSGNGIDVRLAYYGAAAGEAIPAGMTITGILVGTGTQLSGGLQNPSLTAALAALPATPYDCYVTSLNDPASLNAIQTFMNDQTGRWSWLQMLYGGWFTGYRGTLSASTTFGLSRNDPAVAVMPAYDVPESPTLWAADVAGTCMASLRADPAIPLQELTLGVLPPPLASRLDTISERNTLLYAGMSTYQVNQAGQVYIDRMVTTYQTTPSGAPDTSYLDVETRYQLASLIRLMRTYLRTTYARKKLVADGTNIPGGSNMVTSQTVLASAWAKYKTWCDNGMAQNYATFKANSRATNAGNGQISLLLPFDLPNQLRQVVMVVDFLKS